MIAASGSECPGCAASRRLIPLYTEWLRLADRGIETGLNPNAVWRLHERYFGRGRHDDGYELGGEA